MARHHRHASYENEPYRIYRDSPLDRLTGPSGGMESMVHAYDADETPLRRGAYRSKRLAMLSSSHRPESVNERDYIRTGDGEDGGHDSTPQSSIRAHGRSYHDASAEPLYSRKRLYSQRDQDGHGEGTTSSAYGKTARERNDRALYKSANHRASAARPVYVARSNTAYTAASSMRRQTPVGQLHRKSTVAADTASMPHTAQPRRSSAHTNARQSGLRDRDHDKVDAGWFTSERTPTLQRQAPMYAPDINDMDREVASPSLHRSRRRKDESGDPTLQIVSASVREISGQKHESVADILARFGRHIDDYIDRPPVDDDDNDTGYRHSHARTRGQSGYSPLQEELLDDGECSGDEEAMRSIAFPHARHTKGRANFG
ncbi:hypothetical protein THASP1DRAFT_30937 [Thamnocephalis sphaerospora]|uniref:Uncharacterized protein n=1 Tax=Thamnocephalis sphaerospora TaxID=78915 RepID=A0A4V1IWE2_9FUNG|nr:hypothetical protein THASP1DRAFT_30937 [Thamnocephalis sphaerospora]|eukprot:RKP07249.1 hypothetical protein THASP1DRAFT_30937 [Thamnocephalis sphaerospora]